MELYFKDLEPSDQPEEAMQLSAGEIGTESLEDTAEDIALAELSERVSAARLVY